MLLHIRDLFFILLRYFVLIVLIAALVFSLPVSHPLVAQVLDALFAFFAGLGVSFVSLNPSDGFFVELYIAVGMALFLSIPYIFAKLYGFFGPGLYPKERKLLIIVFISSTILFVVGAAFGLLVVAPPSLKILLSFNSILGIPSIYSISDFAGDIAMLMLFSSAPTSRNDACVGMTI